MTERAWKAFQEIMRVSDVLDGLRDWYNYYDIEGNVEKKDQTIAEINSQVVILDSAIKRYWGVDQ